MTGAPPACLCLLQVLLELARSGHPSLELDVLISAAGDAGGRDGPQLLELLAPPHAAKLLACLELINEEGGLMLEAVQEADLPDASLVI